MPARLTPNSRVRGQDHFETFKIGVGVKPRVALRARGFQQADALVETQRLRMNFVNCGDGADHVTGAGFFLCFVAAWRFPA